MTLTVSALVLARCYARRKILGEVGRRSVSMGNARASAPSSPPSLPPYETASFRLTDPPSPDWKMGDGANDLQSVHASSMTFKTWSLDGPDSFRESYRLLTSAIVPRPIAFVSTLSVDGTPNLAPFSYFSMVSHNPPLLSISFSLLKIRPKDTRENILATKEFTVNIISDHFVEAANATSVEANSDIDEWPLSGLTQEPSELVKPARVRESSVNLECELYFSKDIPTIGPEPWIGTTLILGLIKKVHIRESVLAEDGKTVDPQKLRALSRLGGVTYGTIGNAFDIKRPSWKPARNSYYAGMRRRAREGKGVSDS